MISLKTKDIVCAIHLSNNNRTINSIHFIHFLSQTAVPRLYKFNLSVWEKERGSNKWEKRAGCNKLKGRLVCVMFGCQGITRWTGNITWVTSLFSKDQHDKTLLQTQNTHSKTLTSALKHTRTASILNFKQASVELSQNTSIILDSYEVKIVVILPSLTKLICNLEAVQISMARSSHTWCVFVWT